MKKNKYFEEVKRIADENAKENKDVIDQSYVGKLARQRERNRKAKEAIDESKKIRTRKNAKVADDANVEEIAEIEEKD